MWNMTLGDVLEHKQLATAGISRSATPEQLLIRAINLLYRDADTTKDKDRAEQLLTAVKQVTAAIHTLESMEQRIR